MGVARCRTCTPLFALNALNNSLFLDKTPVRTPLRPALFRLPKYLRLEAQKDGLGRPDPSPYGRAADPG